MARANNLGFAGRLGVGLLVGGCAAIAAAQPLDRGADALLAIDQHRASVVEGIVATWGAPLAQSSAHVSIDELRVRLQGLRADRLLAVSLAGTLDGVREIIGAGGPPAATSKPSAQQMKALGNSGDDVAYTPVTPCRLVETRGTFVAVYQGNGTPAHTALPFTPNEVRSYTVEGGNGACLAQLPAALNPAAIQLQVFGMPTTAASGDIEILPQGSSFGSTATMVYIASIAFNTVSTSARINLANNQISVQVRGGGAHLAIDVVGYFRRPGNYQGTHTITGFAATDGGGIGNVASGDFYATVGGGSSNTASGNYATVAGGGNNTASDIGATAAGGLNNTASQDYATVAGGINNTASNLYATVAGGSGNIASGIGATAAGGLGNRAGGFSSFAAGNGAVASGDGSYAIADISNAPDWQVFVNNSFGARYTGGFTFASSVNGTTGFFQTGCQLFGGGGSWSCTSDRDTKTAFAPIDTTEVLRKVTTLPITRWRFNGEPEAVRHLGPMSQDFHEAFGLGHDDKTISMLDAQGVALAAIQGLERLVQEKDAKISVLEHRVAELETLRDEVAALKAAIAVMQGTSARLAAN